MNPPFSGRGKTTRVSRKAEKPEKSKALFEKVLSKGREVDQIKEAKEALEKAGQISVKLMGFLVGLAVGPFDNTGRQGFGVKYHLKKD